jgi:hypothetical protein
MKLSLPPKGNSEPDPPVDGALDARYDSVEDHLGNPFNKEVGLTYKQVG